MKQTTTLAPQRRPGLQTLKSALQRLTMTLMLVMLTAMTAWATTENVNYIDENGQTQTDTVTDEDEGTLF